MRREPTQREISEAQLMKKEPSVCPITEDDALLFQRFGSSYKNSLTYHAQAMNGWNPKGESSHRLGLRYNDGKNLATIGYFQRNATSQNTSSHFHLVPCEASDDVVRKIADTLYALSGSSVYIKKIDQRQRDALFGYPDFEAVNVQNGWYTEAPQEDDTYPERIVDLEITLAELEKRRKESQLKDKYVRAVRKYVDTGKLKEELYHHADSEHQASVRKIIREFFVLQEEKKNHLSLPEDYFNLIEIKPRDIDCFSSLFSIEKEPAAFYFAERNGNSVHVYANIALHSRFPYLSELLLIRLFQTAQQQGLEKANLGGSETAGLDRFKQKFLPVTQNQMHWLVYNPTRTGVPV